MNSHNDPELHRYEYTGISGYKYYPYYENNMWHLIGPTTLERLIVMFDMSAEEVTYLKLRYGS